VGAPLALAITPYGFGSFAYYGSTLGNSALHRAVSEWQPLTSSPLVAIPFALLAATVVRSFLANRQGTTAWDWFALLTLGLASITVIRNAPFFGLAALSLAPGRRRLAGDSRAADDGAVNRRINGAVLIGAVAVSALSITVALSGRAAPRTGAYAASALPNTLERALRADPHLTVAADTRYGDWLLWQLPSLAGRLAIDARYELYPSGVVTDYLDFVNASGRHWSRAASGHRLVILDRTADGSSVRRLAREPGARILFVDQHVIVILRRTSARGAGTA
jgi:hypothetical protein